MEAQYKKVVSSPDLQDLLVCVLAGTAWHGDTERIVLDDAVSVTEDRRRTQAPKLENL